MSTLPSPSKSTRVLVEFRRQELRQPHRAAPGAAHRLRAARRPAASSARAGTRRGTCPCAGRYRPASPARGSRRAAACSRRNRSRGPRSPAATEGGTPNCRSIASSVARCVVEELLALRGEPRDRAFAHVVRRRLHELGLLRRRVGAARHGEIGQRQIGLEPARRRIEGRARDAELLRLGPERLQEFAKAASAARASAASATANTNTQATRLRHHADRCAGRTKLGSACGS